MGSSTEAKISTRPSARGFAAGFLIVRIVVYLTSTGLNVFDTYTDWEIVLRYQARGFNHPLLKIDLHWLRAWYFFAAIGTVLTALTFANETIEVLHAIWRAFKKCYCGKRRRDAYDVAREDGKNFEMKEKGVDKNITDNVNEKQEKQEKQDIEADGTEISDACRCCYLCGWNFTTRAETLGQMSIWFQDVPMLTMAVLYAFSQSTCKQPEMRDVSGDLFVVGLSALASTAALTFKVARSIVRLIISVGLRIKSRREAGKLIGKCGRCFLLLLPEKGDAAYPQDTCAQCCIFPFYFSIVFDFILLSMGATISLIIWGNYFSLLRTPNFDDSLAIFRFRTDGPDIHLLNISNNIIPASNGTFVSFETVLDDRSVVHCLSEFEYREEDFDIFFNTVEVQVVSEEGEFCATKSSEDISDRNTYSYCTLYYTYRGFVLYYASIDRVTGVINRFDDECSVIEDRLTVDFAGPEPDRSIQVNRTIDRTGFPKSRKDLLILYVHVDPPNLTVLFNISVADVVEGGLDKTYLRSFQHPVSGANLNYLIRIQHIIFESQFRYNVREVSLVTSLGCLCRPTSLNTTLQFLDMATLLYGYYDAQNQNYPLLFNCSQVPLERLIPRPDPSLFVSCLC